jgi:hypothetical protein
MGDKYGYTECDWDAAKEEMCQILIAQARVRGMIPYSALCESVRRIRIEPHSFALAAMLGEISTSESADGRGMLSSLVVHKEGDMQPGPGFFELAASLGRDTRDILKCWVEEVKKVHAYWGKH